METYSFKTNLKCTGCVSALMPFMNELKGLQKWDVDLEDENKTLNIAMNEAVETNKIIETVAKAGYKAEEMI